jgi:uncharacterized protein YwgA
MEKGLFPIGFIFAERIMKCGQWNSHGIKFGKVTFMERFETEKTLQKLSSRQLLILSLYFLSEHGYESIDESTLQRAVYFIRSRIPFDYHFFDRPVPYSYDLLREVEDISRDGYIDVIIQVIDESVPRYVYKLTSIGKASAMNTLEMLNEKGRNELEMAVKDFLSAHH